MRFSYFIVVAVIVLNVIFARECLDVCRQSGQSIDALVVSWFAFTTGELWALSKITRDKIAKGEERYADNFSETDEP